MERKQKTETGNDGVRWLRIFGLFLFPAAAILSLGGCFKDPAGGTEGERTAITVSATLPVGAAEASTKAVVDGSTALTLSFARTDETSAGSYGAYGAEFTGTRAAGTGSTALTFNTPQFYQRGGLNTRIIGWYPGGATEAGSSVGYYDASAGTVSWTIDGRQDILSASAQGSMIAAMPELVFNHRLAQIQFWPYAENMDVSAFWGPITAIVLLGQPDQCTMTLPDPATTEAGAFTATGNADFTVRNLPSGNLSTTAARQGDPVMIAPTTDQTTLSLVIIMDNGGVLNVTVPERTYPAGSVTALNLRFTGTGVQVEPTIAISDWATAGELNAYPKVVNGNTIVITDAFGAANPELYPMHLKWTVTPPHRENTWSSNASGYNTCGRRFKVATFYAKNSAGRDIEMTWYQATGTRALVSNPDGYNACKSYAETGDEDPGDWRIPTIAEAVLIREKAIWLSGFAAEDTGKIWSQTRDTDINGGAWWVDLKRDETGESVSKNDESLLAKVRCIKDL